MVSSEYPEYGYTVTIRLEYPNKIGMLGMITTIVGDNAADITAVDLVRTRGKRIVRDLTIGVMNMEHGQRVARALRKAGTRIIAFTDPSFLVHTGGKIEMHTRTPVENHRDLSQVYTPGVGRVASYIGENRDAVWSLTSKANTVAVVSDGTAVLGLGDIGPEAALPVMEGKAILFKELADVDAWPICLSTTDPDQIVETVKAMAVGFGGINLEDISAPRCFEIEERLREELDIPVFHDDQHGTAVVVTAALLNALKIVDKDIGELRAVMTGAGASGVATTQMLLAAGLRDIVVFDRQGAIHRDRGDIEGNSGKTWLAENTNPRSFAGDIRSGLAGADLFIGLSGPGAIEAHDLSRMNADGIVFALANPDPEVSPEEAHRYVRVVATGRSDYPNQINNALCFPGLFRGVLDVRARSINEDMKMAAAQALAAVVSARELNEENIIPSVFNSRVVTAVARAVSKAALRTGVARRSRSHHGEHMPDLSPLVH